MFIKYVSQKIIDQLVNNKKLNYSESYKFRLLMKLRDIILNFTDPLVRYKLEKYKITLPFSHNLPIEKAKHKGYAKNIIRITDFLNRNIKDLSIIDIGGNVGDTAVLLKSYFDLPILSIEPDKRFFSLLKQNTKQFKGILISNVFLGGNNTQEKLILKQGQGTAFLQRTEKGEVNLVKLDTFLNENHRYWFSKFLKTDVDGYDYKILRGARRYLTKTKPVIFFEYEPTALRIHGKRDGIKLISYLAGLGYKSSLFYDNFGKFILDVDLTNQALVENLHNYVLNNRRIYFYDVCAFHKKDQSLFEKLLRKEKKIGMI